jgi:hypothetical protein
MIYSKPYNSSGLIPPAHYAFMFSFYSSACTIPFKISNSTSTSKFLNSSMPSIYHEVAIDPSVAEEEMRHKERLLEDFSDFPPASPPSFSSKFSISYIISRFRESNFSIIRERLWQSPKIFAKLPTRHPVILHLSLIVIYSTTFIILSVWSVSLKRQHAVVYSMFIFNFFKSNAH